MKYAPLFALVLAAGGFSGCSLLQGGKINTSDLTGVINKAALCAEAVNATANDPACRIALQPCHDVYDAGKAVVDSAK